MADASLLNLLNARGYQPVELTNMMFKDVTEKNLSDLTVNSAIKTRIVKNDEADIWTKTSADR